MANAWVEHVRAYASEHGMKYGEAMKDPQCRAAYSGGSAVEGGKIHVAKPFKKIGRAFKDAGDYLGDTKERHYGKNVMTYINELNKYTQAVAKPLGAVPVIGAPAKAVSGISQAQTNAANAIYRDVKPKEKSYFLNKYDKKGAGLPTVDAPLISTVAENEFYQLSKYNPNRQTGGSFSSMGKGVYQTMGGSFKSNGRG